MNKKMRRVFSLVLSLMMVFALAAGVSAESYRFDFSDLFSWLNPKEEPEAPEIPLETILPEFDLDAHWPELPDVPPADHCPSAHFEDIDTVRWYHTGVDFCVKRGIMIGTSATTFEPYTKITRAQLVTMLWRQAGSPEPSEPAPFKDVAADRYYADAVAWAYEFDVVEGKSETKFAPNETLSRQDMAVLLYRYTEQYFGIEPFVGEFIDLDWMFPDTEDISGYAREAMEWAVARGMILGENTNAYDVVLNPKGLANRAQMATVFCRYCVNVLGWL